MPIPWDERCFLNKTTSLCDNEPVEEFRYCAEGDGHFPAAIFLGSDGLDDTFGDGDKLYNFYGNLIRMIKKNGLEAVTSEIQTSLPRLSEIGSKDDMSIAFVYDESKIEVMANTIESRLTVALSQDLESLKKELAELNQRIEKSNKELKDLESRKPAMEREYQRVKADYEKTLKSLQNIKGEKPTEAESR